MKKDVTIAHSEDWQGLFINGKLVMEDHRLSLREVLDAIGVKYAYAHIDEEWMYQQGRLPDTLREVKMQE